MDRMGDTLGVVLGPFVRNLCERGSELCTAQFQHTGQLLLFCGSHETWPPAIATNFTRSCRSTERSR
jgi:hypothetical protein